MKRLIDSQIRESNGTILEAKIYRNDKSGDYSVTYIMNGDTAKTESYPDKSIHFVEDAVTNWFAGIKVLNG